MKPDTPRTHSPSNTSKPYTPASGTKGQGLLRYEDEFGGFFVVRPFAREFLTRMHAVGFEIVIFTAAIQDYADWAIDLLDDSKLVAHRLYRQHADRESGVFIKDLSKLGRDLKTTIIVDNVQENFMRQLENGIRIKSWYDDATDNSLEELGEVLE